MKLRKWLEQIEPIVDCVIWGEDDNKPIFEGSVFNIPWTITELEIGRKDDSEDRIWFSSDIGDGNPGIIINVIE